MHSLCRVIITCNAPNESFFLYPSWFCVKTLYSCKERCQGSARQPVLRLPIHDTILARHSPKTSAPAIGFLSLHPPSPPNQFYLRWPCPQQGNHSRIKVQAKSCRSKQMMAASLCMHAGFTQKSVTLRSEEGIEIYFFVSNKSYFLTY